MKEKEVVPQISKIKHHDRIEEQCFCALVL